MRLGKLVKDLMRKLDATQDDLAAKLKVSQATISLWLIKDVGLSYKNAKKLIKLAKDSGLKVSEEDIV
jgi:transcriptional regulator with XRE-family HTH domain